MGAVLDRLLYTQERVTPPRLERGTYSLEGCCSILLSYGAVIPSANGAARNVRPLKSLNIMNSKLRCKTPFGRAVCC
jgi:hypothetical protein